MILLNFLALFVGNLIAAKNCIDLFLLRRIWLDFGVNEEISVFELRGADEQIGHLMHFADSICELSFLHLIFEGHFNELLIVIFVVLFHDF